MPTIADRQFWLWLHRFCLLKILCLFVFMESSKSDIVNKERPERNYCWVLSWYWEFVFIVQSAITDIEQFLKNNKEIIRIVTISNRENFGSTWGSLLCWRCSVWSVLNKNFAATLPCWTGLTTLGKKLFRAARIVRKASAKPLMISQSPGIYSQMSATGVITGNCASLEKV